MKGIAAGRQAHRPFFSRPLLWLGVPLAVAAPVLAAVTQQSAPRPGALELKYSAPSAARGQALAASCQGCHGPRGVSSDPNTPRLAAQHAGYLRFQLAAFRAKLRPGTAMQNAAARLTDQNIADLAAYFAAQPLGPAWPGGNAGLRAQGEVLFQRGDAPRNIIACAICHGTDGRGNERLGIASVTHQSPDYTFAVLRKLKHAPSFGGIIYPEAMRIALQPLNDDELRALAEYVSRMP
ncbi:cytochrome C [Deinococcus sp. RL]|uniref:c-type cytochrome n=1 Tax=Deinococcus sp. RL TaxID=1489678 RepID=UPI0004D5CDFE|nr:c-type cytochrome [Deinococcus sp. RL]KEF35552.1 cytochrome C [Deinococcus sp. RL]